MKSGAKRSPASRKEPKISNLNALPMRKIEADKQPTKSPKFNILEAYYGRSIAVFMLRK